MSKAKEKQLNKTYVYDEARQRLDELKRVQKEIAVVLNNAPDGKITIASNKGCLQYYLRKNPAENYRVYISKKEKKTIKQYLQKLYCEKVLRIIKKEIKNLESFLSNSEQSVALIQELYSKYPKEVKMNIEPFDMSDEDYVNMWLEVPFLRKPMAVNDTVRMTKNGELVRSKSELSIANALFDAGIPYKYECPLQLNSGRIIYPDFTILCKSERRVKYWEHRGMMDDREYAKDSVRRMKDMQKSGVYLGDNLIITEETSTVQLGTDEIDQIIEHYFI